MWLFLRYLVNCPLCFGRHGGLDFRLMPCIHNLYTTSYLLSSKECNTTRNKTAYLANHCSNLTATRYKFCCPNSSIFGSWTVKTYGTELAQASTFQGSYQLLELFTFYTKNAMSPPPRINYSFHSQMQLILINVHYMLLKCKLK